MSAAGRGRIPPIGAGSETSRVLVLSGAAEDRLSRLSESKGFAGRHFTLSDDRTEAQKRFLISGALCFTDRPLKHGEDLVLEIFGLGAGERIKHFTVGVTRDDPSKFSSNLPYQMLEGRNEKTGFLGSCWKIHEHCILSGQKLTIYFDERTGKLMIHSDAFLRPRVLFPETRVNAPVYIIMDFYGHSEKVRISSRNRVLAPAAIGAPDKLSQQVIVRSEQIRLEPATFAHPLPLFRIKVSPTEAKSETPSLSRMNFAFVETLLRPGSTLTVRLTKLKRCEPVQIALTTEDVRYAYSYGYLSELCKHTYSLPIESDIPLEGDELRIRISREGAVSLSHSQRGGKQKIHVDPLLAYHVVFSMQHISVLTMVGMETDVEDLLQSPETTPQESRERLLSECIICLEHPRAVVLVPCFHFAFCEGCALSVQRRDDARCPVCRETIIDVKKIYAV